MKYHEFPCDPEGVRKILTDDWISRKRRNWPLVKLEHLEDFKTQQSKPEYPLHMIVRKNTIKKAVHDNLDIYTDLLYGLFPSLKQIMNKYKGKLAVCGGAITRILREWDFELAQKPIINNNDTDFDCDLFFYNTSTEEAEKILADCVGIISSSNGRPENFKNPRTKKYHIKELPTFETVVSRNDNVVNVTQFYPISSKRPHSADTFISIEKVKYQFVLRIYPTLSSIIGGFDIGCCMAAFDGKNFYATRLGAWSLKKMANIVDTTRRSTSFEYRLQKNFLRGFSIILPGMPTSQRQTEEELLLELRQFMYNKGIKWAPAQGYYEENPLSENFRCVTEKFNPGATFSTSGWGITKHKSWLPPGWRLKDPIIRSGTIFSTEEILKKYSDYGSFEVFPIFEDEDSIYTCNFGEIPAIHASFLRCNNRNGVFIARQMSKNYETVLTEFQDFWENPVITFDVEKYKIELENFITQYLFKEDEYCNRPGIQLMGEFMLEFTKLRRTMISHCEINMNGAIPGIKELSYFYKATDIFKENLDEFQKKVFDTMCERMQSNAKLWTQDLKGLKWRTQNPGTQWTSSINPIMEDPRMFYGERYNRFMIGIPEEIAETLLLIRREQGSSLQILPRSLFEYLMGEICLIW